MRYFACLIAVCYGVLLGANAAQDDLTKKDLDSLQGAWRFASLVSDGSSLPEEQIKEGKITINGNKWIVKGLKIGVKGKGLLDAEPEQATIKLDPSKKPKAIDIIPLAGPAKGTPSLGIYSIEGDTLKIYVTNSIGDTKRPTEFKAVRNVNLFVLKRDKR